MKRFAKLAFPLVLLVSMLLATIACSRDPKVRRQKFLENGNKLFAKSEFKQAALYYRRALREDATFGEAYYRLGLTSIKLGVWADAISNLQRAFTLDPNNTDAGSKLAEIYMLATTQDPKRAKQFSMEIRDVSDRLLKRDPNSFDGLRLAAFLDLLDNKPQDAIEKYKKANSIKPNQTEVTVPWAQALLNNKQYADAEKLALEQIDKNKTFGPFYDLLYQFYARENRMADAEKIVKRKVENIAVPEVYLQLAAHYYGVQRRPEMEAAIKQVAGNPKVNQSWAKTGDFYFALRENARARQEYETGLKSGKDKDVYQKRLVQLNVAENKTPEAAQLVEQLLSANPKDDEAKAMKSALEVTSGDLAKINKAVADLTSMVRQNGDNAVLHYELARALMAKAARENNRIDIIDQAKTELEESVKLRSDFQLARLLLSQVHINRGDFSKAAAVSEEVLNAQPNNLQALLMRAVAWRGLREYDKAQATFQAVLRANPNISDARFHLGQTFFEQKKYDKAEETFQEMRRISEGDGRWLTGLVQTYMERQRYKDAIALLEGQIAKYPENDGFKISLAAVLIKDKQFQKAKDIYTALLQKNPKSGDIHAMLGELHQTLWESNRSAGMGELKTAVDFYKKAATITPENPGLLVKLGMALEELELPQEARPYYETVLKVEPGNIIALNNYAFIKAEEGSDLDGALTMAQKAKQQAPNSLEVSDTLGWIYIKKNLPDEALRIFRDLVKKAPENPIFRMHLAQAMFQKGDRPGARQELSQALKNNPNKTVESQIRSLLQKI
jgi:tetratricopeptide (TPR) repeat protein